MWTRRQLLGSAAALCGFFATRRVWAKAPLRFLAVPPSSDDAVLVPSGYRAELLLGWGDPIGLGRGAKTALDRQAPTPELQAITSGMGHDGLEVFALPGQPDRLLVGLNHEFAELRTLYPGRDAKTPFTEREVTLGLLAQGVSIFEISRRQGRWSVVPSRRARRITGLTPMELTGPAAGSSALVTSADPLGRRVLGTFANCATGKTPWGTLLTCEENVDDYFHRVAPDARGQRYGLRERDVYPWHQAHARFDGRLEPNEPHRFGWVVEIAPFDPDSTPKKRTALGRFKHETATVRRDPDGSIALYMGDDEAFEHLYKFVVRDRFDPNDKKTQPDLLDHGTLYVARFDAGGRGEWLPLVHRSLDPKSPLGPEAGFADQAEVLVFARLAATALGATPLDRPEWIALDPTTLEVYAALTNNAARGMDGVPGVDHANPTPHNVTGHILRWRDENARATRFTWDIAVLAGPSPSGEAIERGDGFLCPDALRFGADGRLWIGTDAPGAVRQLNGLGHNALLCADLGTREVRRFLTAPRGAEVSGIMPTDDGTTLFVSIQHPSGAWPDGPESPPRSALIAITREDGGRIA